MMSTSSETKTTASTARPKTKLKATKSLPAFQSRRASNENEDEAGLRHQNKPTTRPRLQSRTSLKFNEALRKQASVDFTRPRPRVYSKSKDVPTILVEKPKQEDKRSTRPEMVHRMSRPLKRQSTLDTIHDNDVFKETETEWRIHGSESTQSFPNATTAKRKTSTAHRQRSSSSSSSQRKISRQNNFSMVGGKRNSIRIRKTSKVLVKQPTLDSIPDNGIPTSYQTRYGVRRSTLATSLPKVLYLVNSYPGS